MGIPACCNKETNLGSAIEMLWERFQSGSLGS